MRRALFAFTLALLLTAPVAAQDDVGAATEAICCGADCCLIDTVCRGRGDTNPANSCQECDPGTSQTAWTDIDGCGDDAGSTPPPDDGGGCSVGGSTSPAPLALFAAALGFAFWRRR